MEQSRKMARNNSIRNQANDYTNCSSEYLRLYMKGLVSEERVLDTKVMVASAGIAICNRDNIVIFHAKKKLDVFDFDEGQVIGNEAVEFMALIEGLNKALALNFRRLTFFFDNRTLYKYITGRLQPKDGKIATLVNQVVLLQRKFRYCKPNFVAHGNINFALKFAKDAIVSQINWQIKTSRGKRSRESCKICFEDTDVANMFSIDGCLHRYCFSCMKQHMKANLLNGILAKCPHEECTSIVNVDSCVKFLGHKLVEIMKKRLKEASIPVSEKVYCPYPKCSALMSKTEVLQYSICFIVGARQSGRRKCLKCHKLFCIKCKVPWHTNMSCDYYEMMNPNVYAGEKLLEYLARERLWKQCLKCNHMIELVDGCYHITCRCGNEFCYNCGAEWWHKKATCSCPLWAEQHIIYL